jgi:hypothetical protein
MENTRCTPNIELPIPVMGSIADFLIAEIEEKEKKGVGMGSQHSLLIPGPWKGVPKGTCSMS